MSKQTAGSAKGCATNSHRIERRAATIPLANLDTDQIMPKQFLRGIDKAGLDKGLFHDMRFDASGRKRDDFVLNKPEHAGTGILLAGPNFGCGSSREHAVWGLLRIPMIVMGWSPLLETASMCQSGDRRPLNTRGATEMKITTIGLDLAKNVFQVHGTDARGKALLRKQLRRAQVLPFFARLEPCKVAMEACGSAHYWARKLQALGFEVMLIAPQYVKPFVKRNKNDAADAEAICEAASRPEMPTVPVKTADQQAILSIHRARQGFVKARTAQANQIRGLLAEFGFTIPQGIHHLGNCVPEIIEDGENDLPGNFRLLILRLLDHLKELDREVKCGVRQKLAWHQAKVAAF